MLGYRAGAAAGLAVLMAAVPVMPAPLAAGQAPPPRATATPVAALTGTQSINETEARYQVKGTDLGIMWTDERGQILIAFGDTFGAGWNGFGSGASTDPAAVDWRSNTLARSNDHNPADGLSFAFVTDRPGHAKELLHALRQDGVEITKIPTGGVNVGGRNYMAYMSVRRFTEPAHWITNYNGIAYSDDGGQTWTDVPGTRRPNTPALDDKFQMIAYARRDGFVYAFGTPNGRFGNAYLARVPEQRILDLSAYEYWTRTGWRQASSTIATPIVAGPIGELSVRYDPVLKSWEMMTITTWETRTVEKVRGEIVVRLAREPTGPWSAPIPVATYREYPTLYGGFLHPDSKGPDIYFTMTQHDRYNVSLMHARLPENAIKGVPNP
jgi:catechol 2,3-dioxygenase-like lactoylglutathione lyase family enzyme